MKLPNGNSHLFFKTRGWDMKEIEDDELEL